MLRGTTFYASAGYTYQKDPIEDKEKMIAELKKKDSPIIIGGIVPGAESVKVIKDTKREMHLLPIFGGGIVGTRFYKLGDISEVQGNEQQDKFRIIHNMQIKANFNGFWKFWNNFFTGAIFAYSKYDIVYEVADVPDEKLYEYLTGIQSPVEPEIIVREEAFRGTVFSIVGDTITIKSPRTTGARKGSLIVFLDRNGKQVASAPVKMVFHTMVKTGKPSGKVFKGYYAVIYRK